MTDTIAQNQSFLVKKFTFCAISFIYFRLHKRILYVYFFMLITGLGCNNISMYSSLPL